MSQYQIVLVNLDPTVGSEIQKTRPCVILSPDEMNQFLRTVTIAPMTTTGKQYPSRLKVKHNGQVGWLVLDQIRTIDKARIMKSLGSLSNVEIQTCKRIIREIFVD